MCGIFGIISPKNINYTDLRWLAKCAKQRGKDSSGLIYKADENYVVERENNDIIKLLDKHKNLKTNILFGHSRLITNGLGDNQPVVKGGLAVLHNGIIVNSDELWNDYDVKREYLIDSEIILGIAISFLKNSEDLNQLSSEILQKCKGTISATIIIPYLGKAILLSNNGSLYKGIVNNSIYISSE